MAGSALDDAAFEVRVTKHAGGGFGVAVDAGRGGISERAAVLKATELLVLHLKNEIGLRAWEAGVTEGLRRASE